MNNKKLLAAIALMANAAFCSAQEGIGTGQPAKAFTKLWTADQGDGTYINPVVNADFPDIDLLRVGDTYYMMTTSMYHFPGATILKSKDLVNWEFCCNPLEKIDDNDAYNLINGKHHYSQGQWATSLTYHDGKYHIYFICYGREGTDHTQQILLTATDIEGAWDMTKMSDHYYDSGWLFDDGENGDGNLYVACGINHIYVNKLDPKTFAKKESKEVIVRENRGLEGCRMYHIGNYYYIYATYGGWNASQAIFRSKKPMGPYEECSYRLFENQFIHQGALVETQTGEWWTIIFKDAGAIGRIPYLEPVKWVDGWPVLGNDGIDVSKNGKAYKKPDVGATYPATYIASNDPFACTTLGKQWQWNHNWVESAWSLTERPGYLRLYTASVTDDLNSARNSISQRIQGYSPNGTASDRTASSYGIVKMDISGMAEGDVAGLSVFQNPYSFIAVKMVDGKKVLYSERCTFNSQKLKKEESKTGKAITSDVIYFKTQVNYGTNTCKYYYSTDNKTYTPWGCTMKMGYTLDYFVGQRYYIFNYATKALGGHVDVDWFSTEPKFAEEDFYTPEMLEEMAQTPVSPKCDPACIFPLADGSFNPSIYMTGTAKNMTAAGNKMLVFTSGADGFGGWRYEKGIDISDYKYLIVKTYAKPAKGSKLRLYDKNNYWTAAYECELTTKETVIDLSNLTTALGTKIDPSHICLAGIQGTGKAIYISEIFLSNDGETNVTTGIESTQDNKEAGCHEDAHIYTIGGIMTDLPGDGISIIRKNEKAKKVLTR